MAKPKPPPYPKPPRPPAEPPRPQPGASMQQRQFHAAALQAPQPVHHGTAEMNEKLNPVIDLVSELGQAFNASPKPGRGREPFIDALVAVARFACAVGLREAQWEFFVLARALHDLDAGRVAPVVRPTGTEGRGFDFPPRLLTRLV
jgi:hypothetical protein